MMIITGAPPKVGAHFVLIGEKIIFVLHFGIFGEIARRVVKLSGPFFG